VTTPLVPEKDGSEHSTTCANSVRRSSVIGEKHGTPVQRRHATCWITENFVSSIGYSHGSWAANGTAKRASTRYDNQFNTPSTGGSRTGDARTSCPTRV
jgi:hypothetical protein